MKPTKIRSFFFSFSLISILGLTGFLQNLKLPFLEKSIPQSTTVYEEKNNNSDVLGTYRYKPSIFISGNNDGYSSGGLISLSSQEEPSVEISGYKISGEIEIQVYEANEEAVLNYLTHDKEGKQTKRISSVDNFRYIASSKTQLTDSYGQQSKVLLPISENGIYFLKIIAKDINEQAFVIRSPFASVVKEGNNEFIFWSQNIETKRSLSSGQITIYDLLDETKSINTADIDSQGIAKTTLTENADVAVVKADDKLALIPINLRYLNYGYSYKQFQPKSVTNRFFTFTDRPLYKPGDTIYFKTILRNDDDASYTIPNGMAKVAIYTDWNEDSIIFEKSYPIDEYGSASGEFTLPQTSKTGYYHLTVNIPSQNIDYTYFQVDYFRKPEYSIDIMVPKTEYISKDKLTFTILGNYFSGQPLAGQTVKYKVYSGDYYQYEYYAENNTNILNDDYRYGNWWGNSSSIDESSATLDHTGKTNITLDLDNKTTKNRVYSIEAEYDNGSGNPSFVRKNILVYAGEYDLYRKDYQSYYGSLGKPLDLPIKLVAHNSQNVANIKLEANIEVSNWVAEKRDNEKYPIYHKVTENLSPISVITDKQGNAVLSLIAKKTGSYVFHVIGNDNKGNTIAKDFYAYVSDKDYPYFNSEQETNLSLQLDKKEYQPNDIANFSIYSLIPNRDILLTFERDRVNRFQVLSLNGNYATTKQQLIESDMPNIYPTITSFSDNNLDNTSQNLVISTLSKQLKVMVTPDKTNYGPGDVVTLNVETTDYAGNPQPADIAVWAVDKALFELVAEDPKKITNVFWGERYASTATAHSLEGITVNQAEQGGGCFSADTKILLADGTNIDIAKVKSGDQILTRKSEKDDSLVKNTVLTTHKTTVGGILTINNQLKITPDHKVLLNGIWQPIGNAQIGDILLDNQGNKVIISSLEWVLGKTIVYNLELDGNHTFFANGIWVHNQKGGGRTVFKDTAYWNPSVKTGAGGRATVRFKLPDNLTTWVVSSVGDTVQTSVGQAKTEIIVNKDIIVRPILPNIIREGDKITLSALVQNFSLQDKNFDISLQFDSGTIKQATYSAQKLASQESREFSWQLHAEKVNEKAKLRFAAIANDDPKINDVITQEIPVQAFGFYETKGETGYNQTSFNIKLDKDALSDKTEVKLSLSASLLGTMPAAMEYLVDYPYGCVEQTTSRLFPVLIAKNNPALYTKALQDKKIDEMVIKGIERLSSQQHFDGGWTWWGNGESDPFITAYVVENLVLAKNSGFTVDDQILNLAAAFLSRDDKQTSPADIAAKQYGLTLLNSEKRKRTALPVKDLSPDLAAWVVLANYYNGFPDPDQNGLTKLVNMGKSQGDGIFWEAGTANRFGSRDASTAMVAKTILAVNGDRETAVKAIRFLTAQHQNYYWSNTFATVQVIKAVTDLTNSDQEANPDYVATVAIDNVTYKSGPIKAIYQAPIEIIIPIAKLKPSGSIITITKEGSGQLYSTLVTKQFHTDINTKASAHGLEIKREYVNEKGEEYSLGLGDTALVRLTVSGLQADQYYGVIADELPSGLIPINESFDNEAYGEQKKYYYGGVNNKEYTQNGIVMSLYQMVSGSNTYEYKARVVSAGNFSIPPATTSLMYAPEVYGRSDAQVLTIDKESQIIPGKKIEKIIREKSNLNTKDKYLLAIAGLLILMLTIGLILFRPILIGKLRLFKSKLGINKSNHDNQPPISENKPDLPQQNP